MKIITGMEEKAENSSNKITTIELRKKLIDIKKTWKQRIQEHSNKFKNISQMVDIFQEIYNDKQKIIESKSSLQEQCATMLRKLKQKEKDLYLHYLKNEDYKIKSHQAISTLVQSDLSEYQEKIDIITYHIDFLNETNINIQNILYGIKARTDLEEYNNYQ